MRQYSFNGLAGCVQQRKARQTGTLVGVYHGEQADMERDPEHPWLTVCEVHSALLGHSALAMAKAHAADPRGWCEDCRAGTESA